MIIGIIGQARSGKDTTAKYLVDECGFKRIGFGDKLKRIVAEMFNMSRDQVESDKGKSTVDPRYGVTPRTVLQHVGTEGFRHFYPNVWSDYVFFVIRSTPGNWVISDVRFPNEVQAVKDHGGYIVKVERTDYQDLQGAEAQHPSETSMEKIPFEDFDLVIRAKSGELSVLRDGILAFVDQVKE